MCLSFLLFDFFFFKQKTAYEMRISDWSSDVCSSDLSSLTTFQSSAWTVAVASNTVKPHNTAIRCSEPIIVFLVVDVPDLPHYAAVICSHQPISRKIGRASCRERVCQYVSITVVAVSLKKQKQKQDKSSQT